MRALIPYGACALLWAICWLSAACFSCAGWSVGICVGPNAQKWNASVCVNRELPDFAPSIDAGSPPRFSGEDAGL